jgi:hypothetical protein
MRNSSRYLPLFALAIFLLSATTVRAQTVLFSTFGPSQSFNASASQTVYLTSGPGDFSLQSQSVASAFTVSAYSLTGRFYLNRLDMAVAGTNAFSVQLTADASGQPGTVLETWFVSAPTLPITTVVDALNLQLKIGQQYWIVLNPLASDGNANDPWYGGYNDPSPTSVDGTYEKPNGVIENFGWESVQSSLAFDVVGTTISFTPPPWGLGFNQILRVIVAGPITPAPGTPVEANLSFINLAGIAIGPSSPVTVNPGQFVTIDFHANDYLQEIGQRLEVIPVITPAQNPNGPSITSVQASVEIIDVFTGVATVLTPAPLSPPNPLYPAGPITPSLTPQNLAGGQAMRLNVVAFSPTPCMATLSFADKHGKSLGTSQQVNVSPGTGTYLDLTADALSLQLGQRLDVQPIVTVTTPIGAAAISSACQASVEVFDRLSGRTMTYQTAAVQLPAVQ